MTRLEIENLSEEVATLLRVNRQLVHDVMEATQALMAVASGDGGDPAATDSAPLLLYAAQHALRVSQIMDRFEICRPDGERRIVEYSAVANVATSLQVSVARDMTDRIRAEDSLRRSDARFRALVENSPEIIALITAGGQTQFLTPAPWRVLGWTEEGMGTRSIRDLAIPQERARIALELEQLVLTNARDLATTFQIGGGDGSVRWIECAATNLLDDPDVGAIVESYRDVTERRRSEDALRESRGLLEEAQAIAHVGSWTSELGPAGTIRWSAECCRILGIEDGTAMTVADFLARIHGDDRAEFARATRAAIDDGAPADVEHRLLRPDGSVCLVRERAIVERDSTGRATRMVGTMQDITERHDALEALRASEDKYRRMVESTSEGLWTYDAHGLTTFMNSQMAKMVGYAADEVIGLPATAFLHESERRAVTARIERHRQGISERVSLRMRHKSGADVWASLQVNPIYRADGTFEGGIALVTDVSIERRADEARARLAAIVECSDDAIVSIDADGKLASWNRGAELLYQYSPGEMIGQSIAVLFSPASRGQEESASDMVALGDPTRAYDSTHVRKDGSSVEVSVKFSPVKNAGGTVIATAMVAKDLTAQRQAEALHRRTEDQFRQAQKMEAVGRLAGGIAHDFNNLLSVIVSYTQFAIEDLKPGDPLRDDMIEIDTASRRAAELTRQLLAFSRQQVLRPRVLALNEVVLPMERMLRRVLGEDVTLSVASGTGLGRVLADPGQLEQVVMNLAVNARDAMPDGGSLTIETANVELTDDTVGGPSGLVPGHYVMLAVSDTGVGMDEATRARVFEPFFTTKPQGKGTGLGLSTVFGIVRQSGGHVGVYSEPGIGTTFKVYLPQTDQPADASKLESLPSAVGGSETILLVEDDDQVRVVACAILRRKGYHVLDTSNGGEAFLVAKDFADRIDLLLTDVVMPRMNGRKVAEQLLPTRPEMKVLYVSGYTDDAIVHHGVIDAGVEFIQKPFTPNALLRKVRQVLNTGEARAS